MHSPLQLRSQHGFNLIEVMVAVAVLAIGLLGIAALQISGIRYSMGSYTRSIAVMAANDYAERMYAARPGVNLGLYGGYDSSTINCAAEPASICATQSDTTTPDICSPVEMATYDRYVAACGYPITDGRYGGIQTLLPAGRLVSQCLNAAGAAAACAVGMRHLITVSWQERGSQTDGTSAIQTVNYQMTVQP